MTAPEVSCTAMRTGERVLIGRLKARAVVASLRKSGGHEAGGVTEEVELFHIRCHVAARAWPELVRYHVANWESQGNWPYALKYALAAAIIAKDESHVSAIVDDVRKLAEFRPVFLSAVRVALSEVEVQQVEGRESVHRVLHGELREPWIAMLLDARLSSYAVGILERIEPHRMTALEQEMFAYALLDCREVERASEFLATWPNDAALARLAYLTGNINRAVELYNELEQSNNPRWQSLAADARNLPAIRFTRRQMCKSKSSGWNAVSRLSLGFLSLLLMYSTKQAVIKGLLAITRGLQKPIQLFVVRVE